VAYWEMYVRTTVSLRQCLAPQASLRTPVERKTKESSIASLTVLSAQ
jgi:hypothetical protein